MILAAAEAVAVDPVAVVGLGWTMLVGIIGGIVGGITTGVIIGTWVGSLSSRLRMVEERLKRGDELFDRLAEIGDKARIVSREIDALSSSIGSLQTKEMCAERHRVGMEIGEHVGRLIGALGHLADVIEAAGSFRHPVRAERM